MLNLSLVAERCNTTCVLQAEAEKETLEEELVSVLEQSRVKAYHSADELLQRVRDLEAQLGAQRAELRSKATHKLCIGCQERLEEAAEGDSSASHKGAETSQSTSQGSMQESVADSSFGYEDRVQRLSSRYAESEERVDFMRKMERAINRIDAWR